MHPDIFHDFFFFFFFFTIKVLCTVKYNSFNSESKPRFSIFCLYSDVTHKMNDIP